MKVQTNENIFNPYSIIIETNDESYFIMSILYDTEQNHYNNATRQFAKELYNKIKLNRQFSIK